MASATTSDTMTVDARTIPAVLWRHKARLVVVTGVLCLLAFALLQFVPRTYESAAQIRIEATGAEADAVVADQIRRIGAPETLRRVIAEQDLSDIAEFNGGANGPLAGLFGRRVEPEMLDEAVLAALEARLAVSEQQDGVVSILFRAGDAELAARVANAIAEVHVAGRAVPDAPAESSTQADMERLRVQVAEAEAAVAAYRIEHDLFVGANNVSLLDQQLANVANQISAAQERRSAAESRAGLIRSMLSSGRAVEGLVDVQNSTVVQQLAQEKGRLQGERAQRLASLMEGHPAVVSLTAQIAEIDRQIQAEARRIADALETEAQIEADQEQALRDELARYKLTASDASHSLVALADLERDAASQRRLLEAHLARHGAGDATTARPQMRVIAQASPAAAPSSPRTAAILIAVAVVSLALHGGVLIMGALGPAPAAIPAASRRRKTAGKKGRASDKAVDLVEAAPPDRPAASDDEAVSEAALAILSAEMGFGREPIVLVSALADKQDGATLSRRLVADALERGQSVAFIDAGSAETDERAGLSDLATGEAEFGDVVHRGEQAGLAIIPWGRQQGVAGRSMRVVTLVEALCDIYEVVVVDTGRTGMTSALPLFQGLHARVVFTARSEPDGAGLELAEADAVALGFANAVTILHDGRRTAAA